MSDISKVFERLKAQGDGALIGYVTAGDPEPGLTARISEALVKGGVDIIELGVPFSDPIADGPTIQAASVRALQAGTTPKMVLGIAGEIKRKCGVPVVILTYYNPVFRMGLENFFRLAKSFGVDGVVVPDLPVEEAHEYLKVAKGCGVLQQRLLQLLMVLVRYFPLALSRVSTKLRWYVASAPAHLQKDRFRPIPRTQLP